MAMSREEKLAIYERLVAAVDGIERKGATMPYTSLNGNMFSFLSPAGELAFRLAKAEREAFLALYPDAVVMQHGRLMKDYIEVPAAILEDADALSALFQQSLSHARTLKPKATTRKT